MREGAIQPIGSVQHTSFCLVLILIVWIMIVSIWSPEPLSESRHYLPVDKYGYGTGYILELHSSDQLTIHAT